MSREWAPGDVAILEWRDGSTARAIWQGNQFATQNGHYLHHWQVTARPLVVIDPEDFEQANRIPLMFGTLLRADGSPISFGEWQQALREFADPKPPKPEEPTGLGAVVEDADGDVWVHAGLHKFVRRIPDALPEWRYYRDIDAVRVLSEGVQS